MQPNETTGSGKEKSTVARGLWHISLYTLLDPNFFPAKCLYPFSGVEFRLRSPDVERK